MKSNAAKKKDWQQACKDFDTCPDGPNFIKALDEYVRLGDLNKIPKPKLVFGLGSHMIMIALDSIPVMQSATFTLIGTIIEVKTSRRRDCPFRNGQEIKIEDYCPRRKLTGAVYVSD